jgi:hypothetical protein
MTKRIANARPILPQGEAPGDEAYRERVPDFGAGRGAR